MKAVALILALAVIGCNARSVRQADASGADGWVGSVEAFSRYMSEMSQKTDGVLVTMKDSQLRRELETLISDTMAELEVYRDDIQNKLAPFTQTSASQMTEDMTLLFDKLQRDMIEAKDRQLEYLGEFKGMVETNTDDIRNKITTFTNKLSKRLRKDASEIRETASIYMGEIQSRASQNLQSVRDQVEPYVQQVGDSGSKKLSDISALLQSQTEGLGEQLQAQAEGLKTQLEATAQELRTSLEGKLEELTQMLSPMAAKLREQVETMVEKVTDVASS
ncbi:apolipoprotein Eb [Salarias fasciatus]|uniref:apolipoprotein Eb n=1 Tax=Salarias fasciatus TaxID=181472 RepID=UPI001176F5CC|nr:apolipoprotein Eb-like [Salarias fasciatus]